MPSDPSRRFNIYVKSEPPGADIFLDGKSKPVGATPISLPIDLNGVSSVQMVLKKPGYEDYQQIITTDSPISINLQPLEAPPTEQKPAAETRRRCRLRRPSRRRRRPAATRAVIRRQRPSATARTRLVERGGRGKGEIVDPF